MQYIPENKLFILKNLLIEPKDIYLLALVYKDSSWSTTFYHVVSDLLNYFDISFFIHKNFVKNREIDKEFANESNNYFGVGKDIYERITRGDIFKANEIKQIIDNKKNTYRKYLFPQLQLKIKVSQPKIHQLLNLLDTYISEFIDNKLEEDENSLIFVDNKSYYNSKKCISDLSIFTRNHMSQFTPTNIRVSTSLLASFHTDPFIDSIGFQEYQKCYRLLETAMACEKLGYIVIKKINSDGSIVFNRIEKKPLSLVEPPKNLKVIDGFKFDPSTGDFRLKQFKGNIGLGSKEYKILMCLISAEKYQASYTSLLKSIGINEVTKPNKMVIYNEIKKIKNKLGILPKKKESNKDIIKTIKKFGYRIASN